MLSNSKGFVAGVLMLLSTSTGCTMCSNCELDSYSAYGGRWNRTERTTGRVGSVFDPAGVQTPYSETGYVGSSLAPLEMPADQPEEDLEQKPEPDDPADPEISEAAYYEY
jgi:hypothetical protein